MATVVYGTLDPATDVLCLSSAGHPPPILARPDGETTTVGIATDPPLGVAAARPRRTTAVNLPPGAVVCMYSDGLIERRNLVIDDNIEKLRRTVTANTPESVCTDIMRRLIGYEPPEDDVAVLVIRRNEISGPEPRITRIAADRRGRRRDL
jgi:serine phosphatase RsbU (regulator of sigma subunit)